MANLDVMSIQSERTRPASRPEVARVIVRRRTLPGGRAVTGGFLVALAAVLVFWGYSRSTRSPRQLYVVATHDLTPGERLTASDLTLVPLDIPNLAVRRQVFGSPADLLDANASVIAPINAGSLVEAGSVVGRGGPPGTREMSIDLDRSRAVGGTLKPGEFVDVLATFGSGATAYTETVLPHVEVLPITPDASGTGGTGELFVFAVPDGVSAEALANVNIAAQVTLVRAAEQPVGAPTTTVVPYPSPTSAGGGQ
jgi:Flp pilus assembly protein CpaB